MNIEPDEREAKLHDEMLAWAIPIITGEKWHWFGWLFAQQPTRPFVKNLVHACVECELRLEGLGWSLIKDVANIAGVEKHEPHYEMLLQKLSEILVLNQLLKLPWPEDASFEHEPIAKPDGKRPELKVETDEQIFLFEVKAPALISHQRARASNPLQFPGRMFDMTMRAMVAGEQAATLPRDNPVKDFLLSAQAKFSEFTSEKQTFGILIIVWDDFIYEPITCLVHEDSQGLLTEKSFALDEDGNPMKYPNINSVIAIRHLLYFQEAAAERPIERAHCFDFGNEHDLPNVAMSIPDTEEIPEFINVGLRALKHDDERIRNAADYRPQELIMWFNT